MTVGRLSCGGVWAAMALGLCFRLQAGGWDWRTDVDNVKAEAASGNGLIVVVNMFYKTCGFCQSFYPIAHDETFLSWAEENRVYLVTSDATLHSNTAAAEAYFWKLYRQNRANPHGGLPPLIAVARASSPDVLVGYGTARVGQNLGGGRYDGTAASLQSCLGSLLPDSSAGSTVVNPDNFKSAMKIGGVLRTAGGVQGVLSLNVGKRNAKGECRLSGSIVALSGKKSSLRFSSTSARPQNSTITEDFSVMLDGVKLSGALAVSANGSIVGGTLGNEIEITSGVVGGGLDSKSPQFRIDRPISAEEIPGILLSMRQTDGEVELQPVSGVPVEVLGGKLRFAKSPTVKYVKDRETSAYALVADVSKGRTNVNAVKLTYTAKTGVFKGSFVVFFDTGRADRPKLKKKKLTVSGVVADGIGTGVVKLGNKVIRMVVIR